MEKIVVVRNDHILVITDTVSKRSHVEDCSCVKYADSIERRLNVGISKGRTYDEILAHIEAGRKYRYLEGVRF